MKVGSDVSLELPIDVDKLQRNLLEETTESCFTISEYQESLQYAFTDLSDVNWVSNYHPLPAYFKSYFYL